MWNQDSNYIYHPQVSSSTFLFPPAVLGIEPQALYMLAKHCTTKLYHQPELTGLNTFCKMWLFTAYLLGQICSLFLCTLVLCCWILRVLYIFWIQVLYLVCALQVASSSLQSCFLFHHSFNSILTIVLV
jgi:hypothetical protein